MIPLLPVQREGKEDIIITSSEIAINLMIPRALEKKWLALKMNWTLGVPIYKTVILRI